MNQRLRKYIGTREFYKMVIALIIPIIVQQGVTSFVNLLDNVMVGALGTAQMSGVSISNQLIFIYNMVLVGGLAGASIFGAQYYGSGDYDGMRGTTRIKLYFGLALTVIAIVVFAKFGPRLVRLFLDNEANANTDTSFTLQCAKDYIRVILIGLPPYFIVQSYAGTLREAGDTVVPMIASLVAIFVNLIGNWLLIFGKLGCPALGVTGAAIATVISRYVEMAVVVIHTHKHLERFQFAKGLYRSMRVPGAIVKRVFFKGWPLLANELLWSIGTTFVNRNYSTRGLNVVAAMNIQSTAWLLFSVIMIAMGNAVGILVGQKLGAGETEEAKDIDRKLCTFTVLSHIVVGLLVIACSRLIPMLYNTEPEVRELATKFLITMGASLPIHAYIHTAYFTIRSGGRTFVTMLFDSVYTWIVPVVLSLCLCKYSSLSISTIFFIVQFSDIIKVCIAVPMLRSGFWAKNIISDIGTKALEE